MSSRRNSMDSEPVVRGVGSATGEDPPLTLANPRAHRLSFDSAGRSVTGKGESPPNTPIAVSADVDHERKWEIQGEEPAPSTKQDKQEKEGVPAVGKAHIDESENRQGTVNQNARAEDPDARDDHDFATTSYSPMTPPPRHSRSLPAEDEISISSPRAALPADQRSSISMGTGESSTDASDKEERKRGYQT
ncbi:hypothetical protein BKA66DRAFT_437608 [Pyrenochaeta sp. MPI-SDFR-AT-0127]|nr:hypothetical protein BKA66DRAFT_437608 [Pyrenochaeta sp. MPI-SDFR-AT-0127]